MWESVKSTTHLIIDKKYNWQATPHKKDTMNMRKVRMMYSLQGSIESYCVAHDGKTVTMFERVFDVMLMAHQKLGYGLCKMLH